MLQIESRPDSLDRPIAPDTGPVLHAAAGAASAAEPVARLHSGPPPAARRTVQDAPEPRLARAGADCGGARDLGEARVADLEARLDAALRDLRERDETILRLQARPSQTESRLDATDDCSGALAVAVAGTRAAVAELEAELARRDALTRQLVELRREVDWRDYALRDLEKVADKARRAEEQAAQLRSDHAAELAARDAEIERLRLELESMPRRRVGARAATTPSR